MAVDLRAVKAELSRRFEQRQRREPVSHAARLLAAGGEFDEAIFLDDFGESVNSTQELRRREQVTAEALDISEHDYRRALKRLDYLIQRKAQPERAAMIEGIAKNLQGAMDGLAAAERCEADLDLSWAVAASGGIYENLSYGIREAIEQWLVIFNENGFYRGDK